MMPHENAEKIVVSEACSMQKPFRHNLKKTVCGRTNGPHAWGASRQDRDERNRRKQRIPQFPKARQNHSFLRYRTMKLKSDLASRRVVSWRVRRLPDLAAALTRFGRDPISGELRLSDLPGGTGLAWPHPTTSRAHRSERTRTTTVLVVYDHLHTALRSDPVSGFGKAPTL